MLESKKDFARCVGKHRSIGLVIWRESIIRTKAVLHSKEEKEKSSVEQKIQNGHTTSYRRFHYRRKIWMKSKEWMHSF